MSLTSSSIIIDGHLRICSHLEVGVEGPEVFLARGCISLEACYFIEDGKIMQVLIWVKVLLNCLYKVLPLHKSSLRIIFVLEERVGCFPDAVLWTKDVVLVIISLQLRQLVLFEKRNKFTLILSQSKICQKLGHSLEFEEIEEVSLFSQLRLSSLMPLKALLPLFVKVTSLATAAEHFH